MLPWLSDRTKFHLAVSAVLAVALSNVVFGMRWASERPVVRPVAAVTDSEPPAASAPRVPASPPVGRPVSGITPAPKATAAAPAIVPVHEPEASIAAEEPRPLCDVDACTAAYRTFRASDCTYMPSAGVRRLCSKGRPPQ